MTVTMIVALVLVLFFLLLASETPVFLALAGAGVIGILLLRGSTAANSMMETAPFGSTSSFTLAVIPMYILLGMFALHGGLAERVYRVGSRALGRLPGGMGVATVAACAGFAAVSGSSMSTAASIGRISVGEMRRYGYPAGLSAGVVAAAGTLGILIPPSSAMVIYAILSGESVARLLVAGVVPGILLAVGMAVYVMIRSRGLTLTDSPQLAASLESAQLESSRKSQKQSVRAEGATVTGGRLNPPASGTVLTAPSDTSAPPPSGDNALDVPISAAKLIRSVLWLVAIFLAIFVGIFTGLYTVTESAAVGAALALVMLLVENANLGLRGLWHKISQAALETAAVTSMAFSLLVGAAVFSAFLVMAGIPSQFAAWLADLPVPPLLIVVVILLAMIPAGMFLESMSLMVIFVPLVHPAVVALGYDGIWFAILFVIMIELGLITPPVGMNVFVVSMTAKVRLETVFKGVLPFCGVIIAGVATLIIFPQLVTWLPGLVEQ